MSDDRIVNQIEALGARRLAGCVGRALLLIAGAILLAGRIGDRHLRTCAAFAVSGLLFGLAASILSRGMRKLLGTVFVVLPLVASLAMFASCTLFGYEKELPLRLSLAPLALTAGFLITGARRRGPRSR